MNSQDKEKASAFSAWLANVEMRMVVEKGYGFFTCL
jgi:hypothetical protein